MASTSFTVTVLGAGTPYPRPGAACSGYLLRAGAQTVWVDAGPGTLANLQRHASPAGLSAIWVSHAHADHCADLLAAYYAFAYGEVTPPAPVRLFGPPGLAARVEAFLGSSTPMDQVFAVHEVHDGHRVEVGGGLVLTAVAVEHAVPAFGLRAEHGGALLAYSGDSGPCPALEDVAREADVFICEAAVDGRPAGTPPWHCTPEDAGAAARRGRARSLLVTHVAPPLTPARATTRAAQAFGGPTATAREGGTYPVTPPP